MQGKRGVKVLLLNLQWLVYMQVLDTAIYSELLSLAFPLAQHLHQTLIFPP